MVWAQITSRKSLRDIETSLRGHSDKTYRMGIGKTISRNNISNANANRDVAIYRELAQTMMDRCLRLKHRDEILSRLCDVFRLNGFFAIDSSTVTLPLLRFPWSVPQENCGGIKLHTMYDLLREVPRMCMITGHEERDQTFMSDYPYEPGCFYMLDKMHFKTHGMNTINSRGAYFVVPLKQNVVCEVVDRNPVDGTHVLRDEIIRFTGRWASGGYPNPLRRISFYSTEKNLVLTFVTNNLLLDAATIALLYRYRWQIELFFKWIKQHLRITTFYGTSANAVLIQVYTALISFCILALAADALNYKGSLYEFSSLLSTSLTERTYLSDLIERYRNGSGDTSNDSTPNLFDFDNLLS